MIELLVVITIISLLVSILVPSLQKARDFAKTTICAMQLRGLGGALNTYAHENKGHYLYVPRTGTDWIIPEHVREKEISQLLQYGCSEKTFYCPFKPQEEFKDIGSGYVEIGYHYFACYYDETGYYFPYFMCGYTPVTFNSAKPEWLLFSDLAWGCAEAFSHYFGPMDARANLLFVDTHVEMSPKPWDVPAHFNPYVAYGYWIYGRWSYY
ncbi:MAG: hypothetical protein JXA11_01510 [Phycisphaerae bacterium]|nr:hypothetical protein [Phycisphaerae bacterium]